MRNVGFRVWIDECVKEMIFEKVIKPEDFPYPEDKSHMIFKDKVLDIALEGFLEKLEPLENKCQPIIRTVEKML